jgi:hypothetical protein
VAGGAVVMLTSLSPSELSGEVVILYWDFQ